jgi:PAS domain S-box-containing protein
MKPNGKDEKSSPRQIPDHLHLRKSKLNSIVRSLKLSKSQLLVLVMTVVVTGMAVLGQIYYLSDLQSNSKGILKVNTLTAFHLFMLLSIGFTMIFMLGVLERKHKSLEVGLICSEEKCRFLYEQSPSFNLIIGSDGTIIDINQSLRQTLGYTTEEIVGKSALEFILPPSREIVTKVLESGFRREHTPQIEVDVYVKDGSIHTLLFSPGEVLLCEGGKPTDLLFTGMDITERKRAEEKLIQSEQLFSKAFQTSPNLVGITTLKEGRIIDVNEAYCRTTGYEHDELVGILLRTSMYGQTRNKEIQ